MPFLRLMGDMFPLVKALLAFSSSSFRTLNERSTSLQNTRRSFGVSAADGYSANNKEEESLRRSLKLTVSITLGVVGVGNSETIHLDSFSYAFPSKTRKENNRSWKFKQLRAHLTYPRRYIPRHRSGC